MNLGNHLGSNMRFQFGCRLTVLRLGIGTLLLGGAATANDVESAVNAARKRQDLVKSIAIELQWTDIHTKGSVSEEGSALTKSKVPIPREETKLESVFKMKIDAAKVRLENNHPAWQLPTGELYQKKSINVYDGSNAKTFFTSGMGKSDIPFGIIQSEPRQDRAKLFILTPIVMGVRGLNPSMSPFVFGDLKATGLALSIDGATCREFTLPTGSDALMSFWLDPEREYVVRRMRRMKQGRLESQSDIQYRTDPVIGWMPNSWTRNVYTRSGEVLTTTKIEVRSYELNSPIPEEEFQIMFPVGAEVYDQRNGKSYWVEDDGKMREFSKSGAPIDGSVEFQPGTAWYVRNRWLLIGAAIGVIISTTAVLVRRRRVAS